jgi:tetratricopeptide (TPR) repeat protein
MRRLRIAAAAFLLTLVTWLATPPAESAGNWLRLRSPHFVLVGDVGERELRRVGERLEGFREALRRVLPHASVATPVPITVVVFGRDAAFTPFKPLVSGRPMERLGGYFQSGEDADYIAISLERQASAYPVIQHEYTHALVNATVSSIPLWLNEGLAEFYSTFAERDGGRAAVIGLAPDERQEELQSGEWLPLEQLLEVDQWSSQYTEADRRGMFYGESWALTHYLLLGSPARSDQLASYLNLVNAGAVPADAFRSAFHCEPRELEGELRGYLRRFTLADVRVSFDRSPRTAIGFRAESISIAEAQAYTSELLARQARESEARALLDAALGAEPSQPRALAALGRLHVRVGRIDEGLPILERAASLAPGDPAVVSTLARALVERLRAQGADAGGDAAGLARARAELARAAALDPDDAYVAAMQGYVEYVEGSRLDKARAFLERAVRQAPAREEYQLLLAQVLINEDNINGARTLLDPLAARGSRSEVRDQARDALARAAEASFSRTPPGAPATAPAGAERFALVLRTVEAGETRVDGQFERVDCLGNGIVLSVRTSERILRLGAESFDAVDFINYRDAPVAPPACGPLTQPLRALATYRASPDGDGQVVALEIVPADYVLRLPQ